jgi:guanosine-3',5'-bis(diphosphate) 3'-pyrophosphohydrolase
VSRLHLKYDTERFTEVENSQISRALVFAQEAHADQKRLSGESYLVHPIAVAQQVAAWGLDGDAIVAALLHDVVEDTDLRLDAIEKEFGSQVAHLVDGLTKLGALPKPDANSARLELSQENLRKLLLATSRDYRVIMIKLADRLHNLRTLGSLPPAKRTRIARESLAVYAPLADRLGMGELKSEIEDLAFRYAMPDEYNSLLARVDLSTKQSQRYLVRLKRNLNDSLARGGVEVVSIEGRRKHLYSIYKKLAKVEGDLTKIYDLIAIRIIVVDVSACYQALGLIHQQYKPLIYRIKDYIAVPKPNGYQSLHTTVFAEDGHITEIQIRTQEMHNEADKGLAAHFFYDAQKSSSNYGKGKSTIKLPAQLTWVNQLSKLDELASGEGNEAMQFELFADRIFVFSPRGDLYELPEHSTPVDFAFAVHSDVGLRALGAKVNGRMVNLDAKLENRDVVEIMLRREPSPNRDWLGFVQTASARNRIRAWFRAVNRDTNIASARAELEVELKAFGWKRLEDIPKRQLADALDVLHQSSLGDLLATIGEGGMTVTQAIRRLVPDAIRPASVPIVKRAEATGRILVEGTKLPYTLAPCCQPVYPQSIVGYVTRGKGVTIHRLSCPNLPTDSERYAVARWEVSGRTVERLVCRIELHAANRVGLLSDITSLISKRGLNIGSIRSKNDEPSENESLISFVLEVPDLFVLSEVMHALRRLRGVGIVRRA